MLTLYEYKRYERALKTARSQHAKHGHKYRFAIIRCFNGKPDTAEYDDKVNYTFRIEKIPRNELAMRVNEELKISMRT